jgi:hypothetical protein
MNTADHLRWRTSSRSGNGENCVQLALEWRTSSRSSNGEACVQLALGSGGVLVRDSKNPAGPVLRADLAALLAEVKSGRLSG